MNKDKNKSTATQSGVEDLRTIVNLTQHTATPAQKNAGVVEVLGKVDIATIKRCLNFASIPSREELEMRATALATIAKGIGNYAMIGGALYLMPTLEKALRKQGVTPLYAFSKRKSKSKRMPDGSVVKTAVFEHLGFVEGCA